MSFWSKLRKIFSWIPFLWKMDDGSYISLYMINIKQMNDMQGEILKFSDVYSNGVDFCLQIEEAKKNLALSCDERDFKISKRYTDRAFEIIKQNSMDWWI